MRKNLIKRGDEHLRYEIREIVEIANEIVKRGVPMIWENIGDPVAKGERLPAWMKAVVERAVGEDRTYAYAPTKGDLEARHFILEHYSDPRVCTVEDIVFFNGLGEAINKLFSNLPATARVIGPNPTYPSHATAEAMHHGGHHLTYRLDLDRGGRIDLDDLERKVAGDEHIVGILVINPNNPLGVVHPRADLEAVVRIARAHQCFLVFDEIYQHLVFDPTTIVRLADIVGDVPAISMKGVSKELPWPGSRCGWIEVYNADRDENFRGYVNTIVISKMLEVCSTTLPQVVFPKIATHPEFRGFLAARIEKYRQRAARALELFAGCPVLRPVVPQGVFYLTVTVDTARFPNVRKLEARNAEVRRYLDELERSSSLRKDKLFAYELMGAEGVCVVPLSGFSSPIDGFRMTLLEEDAALFDETCRRIRRGAEAFFRP
ncbi:MAG TPA: pyridoxal phosphate-dependent aminotransferase [Candidatus Limnocylindria bacterium]|nr:pyridoxal phosphate-dependent aminotransferase [Candidatus Limnocylindria bacterium]